VVTADPAGTYQIQVPESEEARTRLALALDSWVDPVVGAVNPGSAAERGGVQVGDTLRRVAGVPVSSWADMVRELGARPGEEVEIHLRRDGADLVRRVELGAVTDPETGEEEGLLGVYPHADYTTVPVSAGEALAVGWNQTAYWTGVIVGFVRDLFTLNVSPRDVGSIGTIAQASGQAAADGLATFLRFMAFFSINLAILNLLPIPILDGGHLVFLGIELVRGQALSIEQRVRWSQVGLVIVVGIMVWALGNDILRALGL
jgi:regulator of sigma E protease